MLSVKELLQQAQLKLSLNNVAALESELLLAHVLEVDRSFFYANPDSEPSWAQVQQFNKLVQRRLAGEPIAYLLGQQEFWSMMFKVSSATLIPRPETELLVETTLELLPTDDCRVADLGTGCGAIALALASARTGWQLHATDISSRALQIAEENRQQHHLENVTLRRGEWLAAVDGKFDAIISNPPYIAANDRHLAIGDCRFEPVIALTPGADSMVSFRSICASAGKYLKAGGWLLFEHGFEQSDQLQCMLIAAGFKNIQTRKDLAGHDRVTIGQYN